MKKIDLGQAIAILANVGVITGIIFLAVEMQQNNRLLAAQADFSQLQFSLQQESVVIENPEFADLFIRSRDGEELTSAEQLRVFRYQLQQFRVLEWEYVQNRAGSLDSLRSLESRINLMFARPDYFGTTPEGISQAWRIASGIADPGFVQLVEAITQIDE